jgi:uncharacterized paraquat-inducible protein A
METTQTYIGLEDLKALRFACRNCPAVLTLPFEPNAGKALKKCPKCGNGWAVAENTSFEAEIDAFARSASELLPHLKTMGFTLSIEISR